MWNGSNIKILSIIVGIILIFGFFADFLDSKSLLDLLFITMGMMMLITGVHTYGEKIKLINTYFVAMFTVNILQWLIVIYVLFLSQIHLSEDYIIVLVIAPVMSISLINQIRRSDLKYFGNAQKTNKDVILVDKMKSLLNDKAKFILISAGIVIMLACLASFLRTTSPEYLFCSSVGMMAIIWGFYRISNKENLAPSIYSPVMARSSIYRESKNVNVTSNYFVAMSSILIVQWVIIYYILFIHTVPVSNIDITFVFTFTSMASINFYIQVRESDLKYIGKLRTDKRKINYNWIIIIAFASLVILVIMAIISLFLGNSHYFAIILILFVSLLVAVLFWVFWEIIKFINGNPGEMEITDNGYLVCDQCQGYYKLQVDESPEDFTNQCECGGKLHYQDSI